MSGSNYQPVQQFRISGAKPGLISNFQDRNMKVRSKVVMQAKPDGVTEQEAQKAPWQRGIETFVYFNGNPFLNLIPFLPKQKITASRPEIEQSGNMLQREAILLSYDKRDFDLIWKVLDDVVMGGKSLSSAKVQDGGKDGNFVRFSGETNTDGGGFCSVRTKNFEPAFDLSEYKGIVFEAKSSKILKYKFNLRDQENWDSVAWQ